MTARINGNLHSDGDSSASPFHHSWGKASARARPPLVGRGFLAVGCAKAMEGRGVIVMVMGLGVVQLMMVVLGDEC